MNTQNLFNRLFKGSLFSKTSYNSNDSQRIFQNESWSQHGEDNIIISLLNYKKNGFYVDIGAHHPYRFSNTYKLSQMGWRGINIDPLPGSKKLFDEARPSDINIEIGISDSDDILIYNIFEEGALNTFSSEMVIKAYVDYAVKPVSKRKVKVITLADCLEKYMPDEVSIDLMNIDVEGFDYRVLVSNNWSKYKPKVIVCEINNAEISKIINSDIYTFLSRNGYRFVAKTVLSCIFVL